MIVYFVPGDSGMLLELICASFERKMFILVDATEQSRANNVDSAVVESSADRENKVGGYNVRAVARYNTSAPSDSLSMALDAAVTLRRSGPGVSTGFNV